MSIYWLFYPQRKAVLWAPIDDPRYYTTIIFQPDQFIWGMTHAQLGVKYELKNVYMRYLRIEIKENYGDFPDLMLGSAIRDVKIMVERNIGRLIAHENAM